MPIARPIVNLGIVAEATAQAKRWVVKDVCPVPKDTDEQLCNKPTGAVATCDASIGQCDGTWWSSYKLDASLREPLQRYWAIAVQRPDPTSKPDPKIPGSAFESMGTDARVKLLSCLPMERCVEKPSGVAPPGKKPLTLIRNGSLYNLYGLLISGDEPPPARITVRREVLVGGVWKPTLGEPTDIVAAEIPNNGPGPWYPDPLKATNRLELRELIKPGESVYDVLVVAPTLNRERNELFIGVRWPFALVKGSVFPLVPGDIDIGALTESGIPPLGVAWQNYGSQYNHAWYNYDFDISGMVSTDSSTKGIGIFFARADLVLDSSSRKPATVSALVNRERR